MSAVDEWDNARHAALVALAERILTDPASSDELVRRATGYLCAPHVSPRELLEGLGTPLKSELRSCLRRHLGMPPGYCGART